MEDGALKMEKLVDKLEIKTYQKKLKDFFLLHTNSTFSQIVSKPLLGTEGQAYPSKFDPKNNNQKSKFSSEETKDSKTYKDFSKFEEYV
jgi:hypothetical protein